MYIHRHTDRQIHRYTQTIYTDTHIDTDPP